MGNTGPLIQHFTELSFSMGEGPDVRDITSELLAQITKAGVRDGLLSASVVGSTGSLTTIEFEPGAVEDLKQAIRRLAPPDIPYAHEQAWHDGNGHSHVQAALLGPSVSLPIHSGQLLLGTWQQVVLINLDNRARKRRIAVHVLGTA